MDDLDLPPPTSPPDEPLHPAATGRGARPHHPHVYHRRRATIATVAVLVLWLAAQIAGGGLGWAGDDPGADQPPTAMRDDAFSRDPATPPASEEDCPPGGTSIPAGETPVPGPLAAAVDAAIANWGLDDGDIGVAVWVEGYGQVVEEQPDLPLAPASNQKILTAMGVLELLDPDTRLVTEVRAAGPVSAGGVVQGDLVVVGGGDPLIKKTGSHSMADLAAELAAEGITAVEGDIVGDESRYDQVRKAPGWLEWEMPLPAGTMSALMVNSNSRRGDEAYLADPTLHNAELLLDALESEGIEVEGEPAIGTAPGDSELVHAYRSPTVRSMVQTMLRDSDNMTAEMLVKEVGLQVAGEGSSRAGMDAIVEALEGTLCVEIGGINDDASGVSRDNRRSAGNWQELLVAARDEPWFDDFFEGLPEAGSEQGTLAGRFLGTSAVGHVWAKTGTIGTAASLSGYAETEGGRQVVFSIVVNGDQPEEWAVPAIDALVLAVQADDS
jgi:D-alanyl-D-alanine carboxypeptidase/D-alanyl-D-alanine-endopeptidase (penicillin-binding protein 4)